jgi:hypothetical protein
MRRVIRDVNILIMREPAPVFQALPYQSGHALEYPQVDELGIIRVRHRSVPKAADRENLAVVILGRKLSEELQHARSPLARVCLLHDAEETSRVRAISRYFIHRENRVDIVQFSIQILLTMLRTASVNNSISKLRNKSPPAYRAHSPKGHIASRKKLKL